MKLKDVSQKNLEQYNDVFADIVNVLLFKGKVVVKPEELESVLPRSDLKLDSGKAYEQERDVLKKWKKHDIRFAIANFGIENQSTIDETMPVRVLSYDAATYMQQLKKKEKLSPVITLVLYFGTEKAWNTGMSLLEILKCSEEVKNLVNDYKINVFNVAFLPKETI